MALTDLIPIPADHQGLAEIAPIFNGHGWFEGIKKDLMYAQFSLKQVLSLALVSGIILLTMRSANAVECRMAKSFLQSDKNAKGGVTSVWSDEEASSLLFVESLNVNTDGTRRSYSVEDFWGEKHALNNLCNAMSDACAGLSEDELRNRRILTQKAFAAGWPRDILRETKISPSIIPLKGEKPCPPVDGFLVSATALHKPKIADVCDISNYVDALTTSAIVIPKNRKIKNPRTGKLEELPSEFAKRNAKVGDLVIAMVPGAAQPHYAVVGDTGPVDSLGEGSIALNGKLLRKKCFPRNYLEVRGKGEFKGHGWTVPKAIVLIFPGTRNVSDPLMTQERIDTLARTHFVNWGGMERLKTCAARYAVSSLRSKSKGSDGCPSAQLGQESRVSHVAHLLEELL